MGAVAALVVSEGRWAKIALIAAMAILIGSTMMVTSHRARTGAVDLDRTGEECTLTASVC